MCKYCKHLEEVRHTEKGELLKAINHWKNRNYELKHALKMCIIDLSAVLACPNEEIYEEAWNNMQKFVEVLNKK